MNYRVDVLEMEFISTNEITFEKRQDRNGNSIVRMRNNLKKKKKRNDYSSGTYEVVYQGKWIVGTEHFYQCKLKENMKRDRNNIEKTKFSYHIIVASLYNMQTFSLGEQCIAIADQIQIAWYRLQNVINRAKPDGYVIEMTALENVPLGSGGQRLKPLEVLDLFHQRGDLIVRAVDDEGKPLPYKPVEPLVNNTIAKAQEYFNAIQGYMQVLRDILGFNEITDGSSVNPKQLVGVSKLQAQATNNSLAFLGRGMRTLTQNMANDLVLIAQAKIKNGENIQGYVKSLGKTSMQFFKVSKKLSGYNVGIRIVERPTVEEQQRLTGLINSALQNQEITIADAVYIENLKNIKLAETVLAYRTRKNAEMKQEE